MHFDTYTGHDQRQVTAIVYLNPGWSPAAGGELKLYPFLEAPVNIAPIMNRLVRPHSPSCSTYLKGCSCAHKKPCSA